MDPLVVESELKATGLALEEAHQRYALPLGRVQVRVSLARTPSLQRRAPLLLVEVWSSIETIPSFLPLHPRSRL
jgi:hypothetical protein